MDKRLLDYDALTGIETWHHYDSLTDESIVESKGDATHGLDHATYLRNTESERKVDKEFRHYAHIPPSVLVQWHGMGVDTSNADELVKMVNRPEWAYLKTTSMRHA